MKYAKQKNIYLPNDDLADELENWYFSAEKIEDRVPSERLGRMFLDIATHMMNSAKFRGYTIEHKEDMIGDAVLKMLKNLKNYKLEMRSSAFNYFTRCAYCAFLANLSKHYKYINTK